MARPCVHNIVHTYIHNGVRFQCFLELPCGDEENKALLRGGMQTERRGRRRKGGREGRGKERQRERESVISSYNKPN